jgi:plasmid maintenance system antidote protein VapI
VLAVNFFEVIGNSILIELNKKNWTQSMFAHKIGVSDEVFKQIVQGKKALNAVEITKIANTLDVDPEKLLRKKKKIYCKDNLSEKFVNSFYNKDNFKLIYFIIKEYINMEEDLHEFKLSKKNTSGK